jgi:catalase (peroxidase I)
MGNPHLCVKHVKVCGVTGSGNEAVHDGAEVAWQGEARKYPPPYYAFTVMLLLYEWIYGDQTIGKASNFRVQ